MHYSITDYDILFIADTGLKLIRFNFKQSINSKEQTAWTKTKVEKPAASVFYYGGAQKWQAYMFKQVLFLTLF